MPSPLLRTLDLHHDHPGHYPCQDVHGGGVTDERQRETGIEKCRHRQRDRLKQKYRDSKNTRHTDLELE